MNAPFMTWIIIGLVALQFLQLIRKLLREMRGSTRNSVQDVETGMMVANGSETCGCEDDGEDEDEYKDENEERGRLLVGPDDME